MQKTKRNEQNIACLLLKNTGKAYAFFATRRFINGKSANKHKIIRYAKKKWIVIRIDEMVIN